MTGITFPLTVYTYIYFWHSSPMIARSKRQQRVLADQQILFIHQRMVDKVLQAPELFSTLEGTLQRRYACGMMRYGSYMMWHSILAHKNEAAIFRSLVLANDPRSASLRRETIFTGILSEEERESALADYAASLV